MEEPDPTQRFSERVLDYIAFRPGYPDEIAQALDERAELPRPAQVADIGCGTGLSCIPFLKRGHTVHGVEPNPAMGHAARAILQAFPKFHLVLGKAANTTLPTESMDLVVAAQAFHWFDRDAAREEFARILRPGGMVALVWNNRRKTADAFLCGYEALLHEYGTDYAQVDHTQLGPRDFDAFFADYTRFTFDNAQHLDRPGLLGRIRSCSYMPGPDADAYDAMAAAAQDLFDEYQQHGIVSILYDTEVYLGRLE